MSPVGVAVCLAVVAMVRQGSAFAHGGGLDAAGCHHVRKTGEYHCHRAPLPAAIVEEKRKRGGAKDEPPVAVTPSPGPSVEHCRAITDPEKRLACFDDAK